MESLVITRCFRRVKSLGVCVRIYAVLHVLVSTFLLSTTVTAYICADTFTEELRDFLKDIFKQSTVWDHIDSEKLGAILELLISYFTIWLIIDIVHLYAAFRENRKCLLPWLIVNGTTIIALSFLIISVAIICLKVLFALLIMPFFIFSYLVSHSYYFELKRIEADSKRSAEAVIDRQRINKTGTKNTTKKEGQNMEDVKIKGKSNSVIKKQKFTKFIRSQTTLT